MLLVKELEAGYGKKQVVFGASLDVRAGEIVALIGPNGAGKSTVLKVVCGLIPSWKGEIRFDGGAVNGSNPAQNVARGLSFAPQGNRVFTDLTVMENLEIGGYVLPREEVKKRIAQVLELFPTLKAHLRQNAGRLSGGEQQMLALARTLIPKPKLLLLDEPSIGLAPNIAATLFTQITEISREGRVAILIVEQRVREVLEICDKVVSMKLGKVAFEGLPDELKHDKAMLKRLFL